MINNKKYLEVKLDSNKLRLKIENKTSYLKDDKDGELKTSFKNRNNLFKYKIRKNSLNFNLKDTNKIYDGLIEFKPFSFLTMIISHKASYFFQNKKFYCLAIA